MKNTFGLLLEHHLKKTLLTRGAGAFLLLAAVVTVVLPAILPSARAEDTAPASTKAPPWTLKDLQGKTVKSSDFLGKVVILDFWATWCPPCKMEIPGLVDLQKKYGDQGLVVVGISVDQDGPEVVKPFVKQFGINYPVVMADDKVVADFGGIEAVPTTFIIDRKGNVVQGFQGYTDRDTFEKAIVSLLK